MDCLQQVEKDMATQISGVQTSSVNRPTVDYHPTIWGDYFLSHVSDSKTISTSIQQHHEMLKEEVGKVLRDSDQPSQSLRLIDSIQRLGVTYHFRKEIEVALEKLFSSGNHDEDDLYTAALQFRLLRQQGIKVSCEVFEKFKDKGGEFKECLIHDVQGNLSLYEAAHLGIRGEDILDEAIDFTTRNLQSMLTHLSSQLADQVRHALNRPIRRCLPRLDARHYIVAYSEDESHNETLLKFAKLDFNIVQKVHQEELKIITEWWKNLDVATKFPYARDRVVECYFWIMGIYFEPQYSFGRKILTKIIGTLSIIDDTYDNYGTRKELELLTEAIQRWDIKATDVLPKNMKMIYDLVLDVYKELEDTMKKEGRLYTTEYAKAGLKQAVQCYMAEAKWRDSNHVPTMEEYLEISLVSTCYPMLSTASFVGMGPIATKEAFEWVSNFPKMVRASSIVCRFMDDIVSHEFEQKRHHVASGIQCYMKQYGVSEKDVIKIFRKEIAYSWKDMNEECMAPTPVPMALLQRILNLTRVMDVIYKDGDGYTNSCIIKDCLASLLKDPLPF